MLHLYQVDVPMRHAHDHVRRGLHVFTGLADGPDEALAFAHDACDRAAQRMSAGRPVADRSGSGWVVCGLRRDWVLDWHGAHVKAWTSPFRLL